MGCDKIMSVQFGRNMNFRRDGTMREDSSSTASKQKKLEELLMQLGSSVERKEVEPTIHRGDSPMMEPPAPAPASTYKAPSQLDWSSDITKLSQKRARIRNRIESTLFSPLPIDEVPSYPTTLNDLADVEQDRQQAGTISDVSSPASPAPVEEIQPLPIAPQREEHHSFWTSGKGRYLIGLLVCLISLGGAELFWVFQQTHTPPSAPTWQVTVTPFSTSTVLPTPTATPQTITPTPTQQIVATAQPAKEQPKEAVPVVSSPPISFESGKVDGWKVVTADDAVDNVKNVKTKEAKDGNYALMVSFDSESDDDDTPDSYPCLATSSFPAPLKARQTITAYVMKHKGSKVQASLYAIDSTGKSYRANSVKGGTTLVQNDDTWYSVTFTLPANFKGSASQVGLILFGYNAVVYIDDISWHS
jgi:hypothetical protein